MVEQDVQGGRGLPAERRGCHDGHDQPVTASDVLGPAGLCLEFDLKNPPPQSGVAT